MKRSQLHLAKNARLADMLRAMSNQEHWDEEAVYDSEIAPLMAQVIAICKAKQIPMLAVFQYCDTEENGAGFCTTSMPVTGRTADNLWRTMHRWAADRRGGHVTLTETHVTNPDGSKVITIGRVS
jgi:hypothetical protein